MNLEQGDSFEFQNTDWIRNNLCLYEKVWSEFIGHDGHGMPLKMEGLSEEKAKKRKKFYQAHYTFALDCYQIDQLIESIEHNIGKIRDFNSFLEEYRRVFLFMAFIGQIRDMLKIIDSVLGLRGDLVTPLQEYYDKRSYVLHGPRMPIKFEDDCLKIPKLAGTIKSNGEWDDKSVWDEVDKGSFIYALDFCKESRDELFKIVNNLHGKIYNAAKDYFEGCKLIEIDFDKRKIPSSDKDNSVTSFSTDSCMGPSADFSTRKWFTASGEG